MTPEMIITLVILLAAIVLFITEWLRVDMVALLVLLSLVLTGILTAEEAVAGFSSTAVLSIGFLFVVGGAVFQTGLAASIADRILRVAGTSERRLLIVLMASVALLSGVISSTGVVALMLPAVISLAARAKIPASRLLMPLSFSALLGGATTLIATPPNIIASETLEAAGYAPFEFFSFTPFGLALVVTGIAVILLIGPRLLPQRKVEKVVQRMETPAELFSLYELPRNLFRLRVRAESPLAGNELGAILREETRMNVVSVNRPHKAGPVEALAGLRNGARYETLPRPSLDTVLQAEDVLVARGELTEITQAAARWNLAVMSNQPVCENDVITNELGIAEVLLRPRSSLIGQTLRDIRFGSVYNLTVLNIRRPGHDAPLDLKTTPLRFGDMLLVQGTWKDIFALKKLRHDFVVMGEPEAAQMGAFSRPQKAPFALIILLGMVLALVLNLMALTTAAIVAAVAVVLTGCLTMDEAYESVDWKSLILIAGMLPMSTALVKVGLVDELATVMSTTLGSFGPLAVIAGLFWLTALLTQVLSNTATALLIAPVALAAAQQAGVDPHASLMVVAIAASMAFVTPIASPVNTLVMTAGNYRFFDYVRLGLVMLIIGFVVTMLLLPLLWPLPA
jgi:di/tricarboxylate transporter